MRQRSESLAGDLANGLADRLPSGSLAGVGLKRLVRAITTEHSRKRTRALRAAEAVSGLSREEFATRVASDPRLAPFLTRVLYASVMGDEDEVLIGLGAALGAAVSDEDKIAEAEIMLARIEELRGHHFRLLRNFSVRLVRDTHPGGTDPGQNCGRDDASFADDSSPPPVVEVALTELHASGLLQLQREAERTVWSLSPLGRDVLILAAEECGG